MANRGGLKIRSRRGSQVQLLLLALFPGAAYHSKDLPALSPAMIPVILLIFLLTMSDSIEAITGVYRCGDPDGEQAVDPVGIRGGVISHTGRGAGIAGWMSVNTVRVLSGPVAVCNIDVRAQSTG